MGFWAVFFPASGSVICSPAVTGYASGFCLVCSFGPLELVFSFFFGDSFPCPFPFSCTKGPSFLVQALLSLTLVSCCWCGFFAGESSRWSRRSQSPSRASSRGGFASHDDGARHRSWSHLRSWADEDRQKEQSLLDFVSVVAALQSLS